MRCGLLSLLLAGCMLSGCAQYQWQKAGSTTHDLDKDTYECQSEAALLYPPQHVRDDLLLSPSNSNCTNLGNNTNCTTATLDSTRDVNAHNRNQSITQCMSMRGWQKVEAK